MRTPTPPGEIGPSRGRRTGLQATADTVFPVTPMLDMAFQLLAFFLLVYRPSSSETRIDLVLPAQPATSTTAAQPGPTADDGPDRLPVQPAITGESDEGFTDLEVRARSDAAGLLTSLELAGAKLDSATTLSQRLQRYRRLLSGRAVRVRLVADDNLLHAEAARVIAAIHNAGVASIKLAGMSEPSP